MKKQMPYIIAFLWTIAVTGLLCAAVRSWGDEWKVSLYYDGCTTDERIYLIENIEEQGVLYVLNSQGVVEEVFTSSSIRQESRFRNLDYRDGLYGVLVTTVTDETGNTDEYQIVRFDDSGNALEVTPAICPEQSGRLTGFQAVEEGFYLTFVLENGNAAGTYFIDKKELSDSEQSSLPAEGEALEQTGQQTVINPELSKMAAALEGRRIVEADYENDEFILRYDDGGGIRAFAVSDELQSAFGNLSLSYGQLAEIYFSRIIPYIGLLFVGYLVIILLSLGLRNRSHTVYTIALVETMLLMITITGGVHMLHAGERISEEENRFCYYYLESLAESFRNLQYSGVEVEDFYNSEEYDTMQGQVSEFMASDEISDVFLDICFVRSGDYQILVSASGYNGEAFRDVYMSYASTLLYSLEDSEERESISLQIDGSSCRIIGIPVSDGLDSEYMLLGIIREEDTYVSLIQKDRTYFIAAAFVFLMVGIAAALILLIQERDLKKLAGAMRSLAGGQTQLLKVPAHGKDVNLMWNSLLEIQKNINRINYTINQTVESCYRFVPQNIEKILGKNSIEEVKSGDMVSFQGTLALISSAEPESLTLTTADCMNRFLKLIEKQQEECKGFFASGNNRFRMLKVLFLEQTKNTVDFGTSFMSEFHEISELKWLNTCIVLHYSKYAYGVAGTEQQSFPFLLSKETDGLEKCADWLRSMGLKLVITETVKQRENPKDALRYIGYIRNSVTGGNMHLYEVLDACPLSERRLKAKTDAGFQKALKLFYQHDFYLARSIFSGVLKENPEDYLAKWYLFTCEKYLNEAHFEDDICRLHWDA